MRAFKQRSLISIAVATIIAVSLPAYAHASEAPEVDSTTTQEEYVPQELIDEALSADVVSPSISFSTWEEEIDVERAAELEANGVDPSLVTVDDGAWTEPPADLVALAGDCDIPLAADVDSVLGECAAANSSSSQRAQGTFSNMAAQESNESGSDEPETETPELEAQSASSNQPISACLNAITAVKYLSRYEACFNTSRVEYLVNRQGQNVGSIRVEMVSNVRLQRTDTSIINHLRLRYSNPQGAAVGRSYGYRANYSCWQGCAYTADQMRGSSTSGMTVGFWTSVGDNVRVGSNPDSGQAIVAKENYVLTTTSPGVAFEARTTGAALSPRCDNNGVSGLGSGCVFPAVTPTVTLSLSGAESGVAAHVRQAIASGLPSTLTRTTPTLATSNRDRACPSRLTKETGYECDEYPFASSKQGAASGGSARIPSGCIWAKVDGGGSVGYSRCQVLAPQNRAGGRILQDVYRAYRVLPNDKYFVRIVG